MPNEEQDFIESNNDTEQTENDVELVLDDSQDDELEALRKENQTLKIQKAKLKQKLEGGTINNNKVEQKPYNILEDEVAGLILDGYTKEETKFILANGGRKALDSSDSFVSAAINAKREQKRIENAVSETTSNGFVGNGGKTYTQEQLANMSAEEMEKILPHA